MYSALLNDCLGHLHTVLYKLCKEHICAKLKKCAFLQCSVEYLGHIISAGSIGADSVKLKAVSEWSAPIFVEHV